MIRHERDATGFELPLTDSQEFRTLRRWTRANEVRAERRRLALPLSPVLRGIGVTLIAIALAVLLTYPLAFKMDRAGRLDTSDGQFSLWNVSWVAHALTTSPRSLFDANIFYPHRYTLSYSETNLLAGALGIPAYLATANPFATHNSVVLLAFVFSFLAAYALARHLVGSDGAALLCAIAYAYCPYVFARMTHVQLLMTFGLPASLLAFHRLIDRPTLPRGAALAAALAAQALACAYYGIFAALAVGLGVLYYGVSRRLWRSARHWTVFTLTAGLTLTGLLPFLSLYFSLQENFGFIRTLDEAKVFSADWRAWFASSAHAHRWLLSLIGHWNEVLFPGVLTTTLGLTGIWLGLRRQPTVRMGKAARRHEEPLAATRETTGFYALLGAMAFWASFGPQAGLYAALYAAIPVFSFLRAPARFGILVALVLAVLLAIAVRILLANISTLARRITVGALACAMVAELATAPLYLAEAPTPDDAYRRLATLPRGALVEMPFFHEPEDFRRHSEYMLTSTFHWQPLINGYSDHIPADFRKIVVPLSSFPSPESFRLLRARQARYVAFHWKYYDQRSIARVRARLETYAGYLAPLSRTPDVWLFAITSWPDARELATRCLVDAAPCARDRP